MIQHILQRFAASSDTSNATSNVALIVIGLVLVIAILYLVIGGLYKIFVKSGKPGWAAIVPIYNSWVIAEIVGKPGWWGLYPLLGLIPFVGGLISLVISVVFAVWLAKVFGKGALFAVFGLVLFPFVGIPMLGFGSAKYDASAIDGATVADPTAPGVSGQDIGNQYGGQAPVNEQANGPQPPVAPTVVTPQEPEENTAPPQPPVAPVA